MNKRSWWMRARQRCAVRETAQRSDAYAFFNVLTSAPLLGTVEGVLPEHRERVFTPTETLAMFLGQALSADRSCQGAVNEASVKRLVGGLTPCSTNTGGYCRARQRLPREMVTTLTRHIGSSLSAGAREPWRWQGRRVRLVDGTTLSMPDTPDNQAQFPQSRSQKPGLGFPLCRLGTLICLDSGALLDAAVGPYQGKGSDEQSLLRTMLDSLECGDVLVGDAYYPTYFLLCQLRHRGVDGVFEQHGARRRSTDFRLGMKLGRRDHLIEWQRPSKPDWMSQDDYEAMPETLTVREFEAGHKIMVTTLLSAREAPRCRLKALYGRRWNVELDLRSIKDTLGMGHLSCTTPAMVLKELWVYLLAYNLIRLMMAQAASRVAVCPRELSFKHTLQLWNAWTRHGNATHSEEHMHALYLLIAQQRVGQRPGRIEPRAVKRRPKPFPLLMVPRREARATVRLHGHPDA